VSLFEPDTEIIRKGKAQQADGVWQAGAVAGSREPDHHSLRRIRSAAQRPRIAAGAVEAHEQRLGRVPELAAADAGYYSQAQERAVEEKGVKQVAVPNRNTRSSERKKLERSCWFKKAQARRTGCEGRISVLKRRHGLWRCLYRGIWKG
jgi:transposase, IS5 family